MPYATSNPPRLIAQAIGGGGQIWQYESVDAQTLTRVANYFTNGGDLGMAVHAHIFAVDNDASPRASWVQMVNATGNGTTDTGDGLAITATDSD